MKCPCPVSLDAGQESHPSRGAWIEICRFPVPACGAMSHPSRGAWIEIPTVAPMDLLNAQSHPSRGAWIEISEAAASPLRFLVAPLTGCVD